MILIVGGMGHGGYTRYYTRPLPEMGFLESLKGKRKYCWLGPFNLFKMTLNLSGHQLGTYTPFSYLIENDSEPSSS